MQTKKLDEIISNLESIKRLGAITESGEETLTELRVIKEALSQPTVVFSLQKLEDIKRIAYLQGVTEYTIWADYVPNGNEICDKYQEELKNLINKL